VYFEMKEVLRQSLDSGILYNATLLRDAIVSGSENLPVWKTDGFNDIRHIGSGDLMEHLNDAISRYGLEDVVVLCRSNKRANRYNKGIRGRLLYREEDITKGDRVMVVKNCYQFLEGIEEMDFIANGDVAEIMRIHKFSERYGFRFAEAVLRFPDYNSVEINVKVLLNTLDSESPALPADEQQRFFTRVMEDYAHIKGKRKRYKEVREDPYLNALQIKYATALTCHKAQGGQWKAVFVDKAFFGDICTKEALRWYYTAFTRAQEQLYLVNL
jgi:exodeoxyribonuclease-5